MSGAAGFKRDSVQGGSRGMPNPGLTGFSYNDPSQAGTQYGGGMASNT